MKASLFRLLQVRRLLEERAGHDLQRKASELRRLEDEAKERHRLALEARSKAVHAMLSGAESWLELADAEIFLWRKRRTEAVADRVGDEVTELEALRMARRMETQQTEALVSEMEQAQNRERRRREQQHLDEWFRSRMFSGSRGSR